MSQVPIVCTHQTSFFIVSPNILMTTSHDQCRETILQIISLCLVQNSCMNKRAIREMPVFYPKMPIFDMWTAKYSCYVRSEFKCLLKYLDMFDIIQIVQMSAFLLKNIYFFFFYIYIYMYMLFFKVFSQLDFYRI